MKKLEQKQEKERDAEQITKGEVATAILRGLAIVGVIAVGVTCPNLLQIIPKENRRRYSYHAVYRAVHRLDKKGWLVLRQTDTGWKIQLTKQGRMEALAYELGERGIEKPKRWDNKWRVLIFDVPEKKKYLREKIRHLLRNLGFIRLQDSVWVHPYECQQVLELLRTKYQVRSEALYIRAESIDNDAWLKKDFKL